VLQPTRTGPTICSPTLRVTVEVGAETSQAIATVITGEERDRLYARQAERYPQFAECQRRIFRTIPVIALERTRGS